MTSVLADPVLGVWKFDEPRCVRQNAENVCRITHYDPRCVGSCVAVCLAISAMLRGAPDTVAIIREVAAEISTYDPRIMEYFDTASRWGLEHLRLDEGLNGNEPDRIGYTLKAMGSGFWAIEHAASFEDGILQIIHEGGDADTNAAVAGAMLGAKFGYSAMPREWIDELAYRPELDRRVEQLVELIDGLGRCPPFLP